MTKIKSTLLIMPLVLLLSLALLPMNVAQAEDETLFSVTIIAPGNANMLRRQWGQIIANSLIQLGIDARVVYLGWASVYDRVFTPAFENVGKTYDEGGFDIQLVGWTPGLLPEPSQLYYGDEQTFAPTGSNYYLYNNTEANDLMDIFLTTSNITEREQAAMEMQTIFFNELPASQIFYEVQPAIVTPELGGPALSDNVVESGPGWLYFNVQPNPEMLNGKSSVVYCSTGEIESLIPTLSNSWYDTIINAVIHNSLAQVEPDLSDLSVPALLTDWAVSENGFKWTWTVRSGVTWHDGEPFNADDVVFSYWALMEPETGTQHIGSYSRALGNNVKFTFANGTSWTVGNGTRVGNVTAVDASTVELWLPELVPGKAYGYWDPYLLGFANNIIPKHIYEKIPPADWTDSPFNTGQGTIVVPGTPGTVAPETYNGPVGTGPYKWVSFDPVGQIVHLEKYDNYWNKTTLEANGLFTVEDYYIRFIADKTPALAALKNEEVDMLDLNYYMQIDIPTIDPAWGTVLLQSGTGRQEVGYNQQHPILGTGVDTPLGQSDPSKAAEAASYVRVAIDYAIPRQLIIDNLIAGFGDPGATIYLPSQPYYNTAIIPRSFNLTAAQEYLEMAGYGVPSPIPIPTLPSFIFGMSTVLSGVYTDPTLGNPVANRELLLMHTTDNTTFTTSTVIIDRTTTDLSGWYSFTVTPPGPGTYYYYLFDSLRTPAEEEAQWMYLTSIEVSSLDDALKPLSDLIVENGQDIASQESTLNDLTADINSLQDSVNTMTYVAIAALAVAVILGLIAIVLVRRR